MSEDKESSARKNRLCNIRAPSEEWFTIWQEFEEVTKNLGLDNCFVVLSLCKCWLKAHKQKFGILEISGKTQIIFVSQMNQFNYNVGKPRRERFLMDCSRNYPKCTLCSRAFQSYIIEIARELGRSFCFRDFTEINHDLFRKLILELKKSHRILPMIPRSNPETYILPEWKPRYPSMNENNRVKPNDTGNSGKTPIGW